MEWTREALEARIFEILRDDLLSVDDSFTVDSDLIAAGLDSMAVTQLMLAIEESTGVWVDEGLLTPENLASARALATCVFDQLQQG
jgi:acyl carrier protein